MTPRTTTKMDLPFVIDEARQVYETEPVAAALMLYEGILALERSELPSETSAGWHDLTPTYGQNVLRTAFWTLKVMGEDASAGMAPTPAEWDMNISVAQSIVRMMEKAHDAN